MNLVSGMGTRLKTEVPYDGRAPEAIPTDGCWDFDLGRFAVAGIHAFHHFHRLVLKCFGYALYVRESPKSSTMFQPSHNVLGDK